MRAKGAWRGGRRRLAGALALVAALCPAAVAPAGEGRALAQARAPQGAPQELRIRNHRGGYLPGVVAEMAALNRAAVPVRIDGGFCFSACTVFLALDRVCVAPWTQFGFHAPHDPRTGRPLTGAAFERATAHVAGYYRPALADWWLREGRHAIGRMALRSGAELIAIGYPACPPQAG
jgi:hypothetical protein